MPIQVSHVDTCQGGKPCQVLLVTGIHSRARMEKHRYWSPVSVSLPKAKSDAAKRSQDDDATVAAMDIEIMNENLALPLLLLVSNLVIIQVLRLD